MNNMQQILAKAKKLQAQVETAQKQLGLKEITGSAGSESVSVVMNLNGEVKSISIKEEVIDSKEKEMLEDLILAALNDAKQKADAMYKAGMDEATGGLGSGSLF
jgi:DNA-binding YbaB/EbfC family protein